MTHRRLTRLPLEKHPFLDIVGAINPFSVSEVESDDGVLLTRFETSKTFGKTGGVQTFMTLECQGSYIEKESGRS